MNSELPPSGVSLAIAMPVFNEQSGICETLLELDRTFSDRQLQVELFLQDDQSTDNTIAMVRSILAQLHMQVNIGFNVENVGHGPTTFAAYLRAVSSGAPVTMQLDSDGQFFAPELFQLYEAVLDGADNAIGVRIGRVDPWYRKAITFVLKTILTLRYRARFPDPNTPIRVFSTPALARMLSQIPGHPLIPNIYLTITAAKSKLRTDYFDVSHRLRRGSDATGTMWKSSSTIRRLLRLLKFTVQAFMQLLKFRPRLR